MSERSPVDSRASDVALMDGDCAWDFGEPENMTPAQRLEALAEVLAEGFLHLAATGELANLLNDSDVSLPSNQLDVQGKSVYPSTVPRKEVGMNGHG